MTTKDGSSSAGKKSRKDYLSNIEPRWCVGCGAYAVFKGLTSTFAKLEIPKEDICVISGIGCSSRFPYYVDTYGIHSLHGRAAPIAMGTKISNPDLSVWIATGDGDALSIGGNHFLHLLRKNPDIKMILFDNQIYGLTKGQASPTTPIGQKTYTTPYGAIENPVKPMPLALAAGATFTARVLDSDIHMIQEVLEEAQKHKGMAFIEVLLNCVIFNDGAYKTVTSKETRDDNTVALVHGKPMIFGKNRDKGICFDNQHRPCVVKIGQNGITEKDLLVFDKHTTNTAMAYALAEMEHPEFPLPLGIFNQIDRPVYDRQVRQLEKETTERFGEGDLQTLLNSTAMWSVDEKGEVRHIPVR